jgi:hypothetical protein
MILSASPDNTNVNLHPNMAGNNDTDYGNHLNAAMHAKDSNYYLND